MNDSTISTLWAEINKPLSFDFNALVIKYMRLSFFFFKSYILDGVCLVKM